MTKEQKLKNAGIALANAALPVLNLVEGHIGRIYTGNLRHALKQMDKLIKEQPNVRNQRKKRE